MERNLIHKLNCFLFEYTGILKLAIKVVFFLPDDFLTMASLSFSKMFL